MRKSEKKWQVETQGQIYEVEFEELKQWIVEGAVLSSDKVKCGELRWLTVEKVPELNTYFNSDKFTNARSDTFFTSGGGSGSAQTNQILVESEGFSEEDVWEVDGEKLCYTHKDSEAVYACLICKKLLCKICPNSYGGKVKICPLCGSLCLSANERLDKSKTIGTVNKPYNKTSNFLKEPKIQERQNFRLSDFIKTFCDKLIVTEFYFSNLTSLIASRLLKRLR